MLKARKSAVFAMGFCLGLNFSLIFKLEKFTEVPKPRIYSAKYQYWGQEFMEKNPNETSVLTREEERFMDAETTVNRSVAFGLKKNVRIVCWIMTKPVNVTNKLNAIKTTWGKRCNKLLLLSSVNRSETGTIGLHNVREGRDWLWAKTKQAFKYIYAHHLGAGEWFLKADDDTFIIMENLRYLLSGYDPMKPLYFGCRLKDVKPNNTEGYMSGGSGYVLSKESVRRFVEMAVDNPNRCRQQHTGDEDLEMGRCLAKVGVKGVDTRDNLQFHRFLPFYPGVQLTIKHQFSDWYWKRTYYPQKAGFQCCSDFAVSFHYLSFADQYVLEFFIYHFKLYGVSVDHRLQIGHILTKTYK